MICVFILIFEELLFFLFIFIFHLFQQQFFIFVIHFYLSCIGLIFLECLLLVVHLFLIHVIGTPHEEFSVADFANFAHFNFRLALSYRGVIFTYWLNNSAAFHMHGSPCYCYRLSHLLLPRQRSKRWHNSISTTFNLIIGLFLWIWLIYQVATKSSHLVHTSITGHWATEVAIILLLCGNHFGACNTIIRINLGTTRFG